MQPKPISVSIAFSRLRWLFFGMAAVLVLSLIALLVVRQKSLNAHDRLQSAERLTILLRQAFSTIQDAETGQRGFLLTRQEAYLEPYESARAAIKKYLVALDGLGGKGILPAATVAELQALVLRKGEELQKTLDLARTGSAQEAMTLVRGNSGKMLMDEIRLRFEALLDHVDKARSRSYQEAANAIAAGNWIFLAVTLSNLAFLVWAYRRLKREIGLQYVAALETERQREILAVTLTSIGDAVIITDTAGRITFLNTVAETLTGWTTDDAMRRPCAEVFRIINEESRKQVESPVDKVLASGAVVGLANHTLLIRRDGTEVPIDDSGAPIREADGNIRGVVLVFRDFSEHKKFEKTLLQAKEDLEEAAMAKDRFLATLSHELRTPLTPVLATLSAWEVLKKLPEPLRPDLQRLRRNIELEAKLIDDLLDITRIEHGKLLLDKSPADVHGLLEEILGLFREETGGEGIELAFQHTAGEHHVLADTARMQQVFWNLLGNAIKFSPMGGTITISTRNPGQGRIEITFVDQGVGMDKATMDGLFQYFHQGSAKPRPGSSGLGLGLSIAKALVEAHGGTLSASSAGPGAGSCFCVALSTVPAPVGEFPEKASQLTGEPSRRILILEDHEDTANVLAQILTSLGHHADCHSTIGSAERALSEGTYDLILSDLGLPDGNGLDFLRSVRKVCQVPAVALTGYGMADDIQSCLDAGFDAHLTKPLDMDKLQKSLGVVRRKQA